MSRPFAVIVARTDPEAFSAKTDPLVRALAIDFAVPMSDPTGWVTQVVKLTLEPVRFVPENAQNDPLGHVPTARVR